MTRKAGCIRVQMTDREAAALARAFLWFAKSIGCHPVLPGLLSADDTVCYPARGLIKDLIKASRHNRNHCELRADRTMSALTLLETAAIRGAFVPTPIMIFSRRCREVMKRRGCPRLTRRQLQQRILQGEGDERELRRLRKRERLNAWLDGVKERGETLLTYTVPPP